MYNKVVFVVTERHMINNYSYLIQELSKIVKDLNIYYLPFFNTSSPKNIIINLNSYVIKLKEKLLKDFGSILENTIIVYSNAEGPIINNRRIWMPELRNCKEVLLQHGFMDTRMQRNKVFVRNIINFFLKLIPGYRVEALGSKFGESKADYIIVFGEKYKRYVMSRGWREENVLVSGNLLKPIYDTSKTSQKNTSLLLLQDLTLYGLTSGEMTAAYNEIVRELSESYDKVIIRKHPKSSEAIYNDFCNISNKLIFSTSSLEDDIKACDKAFSVASTAIADAYIAGREVVSIKVEGIKDIAYEAYERVVPLSEFHNYLEKYKYHDSFAKLKDDYFKIVNNTSLLLKIILN